MAVLFFQVGQFSIISSGGFANCSDSFSFVFSSSFYSLPPPGLAVSSIGSPVEENDDESLTSLWFSFYEI